MPDYTSLATEITAIKSEIAASLGHTTYSAQDLVYLASALDTLGGMLGVNDIVTATADKIADLETKKVTSLASMETARVEAVADVVAERATAISNITTLGTTTMNQINSASTSFNVLFIGSMI
jgi:hypothetical protein